MFGIVFDVFLFVLTHISLVYIFPGNANTNNG